MSFCRILALLALVLLAACGRGVQGTTLGDPAQEPRFRLGDDLRWAQPGWNDGDWERRPISDPPDAIGLLWGRFTVDVEPGLPLGLDVTAAAARQVYWDGILLGQVGQVGDSYATERAGPIDAVFPVPDALATPGPHVVAVRFSNFRRPRGAKGLLLSVSTGKLVQLTEASLRRVGIPLLFLGGFLLVALYYGVLFAVSRRRLPYLLTSALCLAVAALLVAESWRPAFGYSYEHHGLRLRIVDGLTCAVGGLLAGTFVEQFQIPRGKRLVALLMAACVACTVGIRDHESGTYAAFILSLSVALGITGWATSRRRPGARFACFGVAICMAFLFYSGHDFMETSFFPAFALLTAGILTSLGLQSRVDRQRFEAAQATAARLESELLKKHLQPHFLMNTLTSVMEWVETDPALGARAIEALASELRALSEVSGERLIPMSQEVHLCRAHLEVMGYRRSVKFQLDTQGVDLEASIPPAVVHTLIENAVTHNAHAPGRVRMELEEFAAEGQRRITLRAPIAGALREARREGGGLRYVKARLEESFPGQWSLSSSAQGESWVTEITVPAEDSRQ